MVNVKLLRKRIAVLVGFLLVAELLTAAPAMASSEDLTITKVAATATASDSFPFTVTKTAGTSPTNIFPNGTPSVAFNLNSSNSFTKTFSGFQNATTGVVTSPNNYTITESTPSGWNAPTIVCQVTNSNLIIAFNTSTPGSVSFEYTPNAASPGAHILCTFTNTRNTVVPTQTGTLTIIKDAQPNDPQDFNFVTQGAGLSNFDLDDDPSSSTLSNQKTFTNLAAGVPFTVTEGLVNGWTTPSIQCIVAVPGLTTTFTDQLNRTFTVNLTAGANVTCTIINVKTVVPIKISTTVSALTIPAGSSGTDSAIITGAVSGTAVTYNLFAGSCPAQASNVPIFTSTVTVSGGSVPNSLPYTFNTAGQYYWVVVYNGSPIVTGPCEPVRVTAKATATLTVIKRLLPANGNPNTFNLIITGPPGTLGSGTTSNVGNLGTTGAVTITSGQNYIVSESAGNGGTNLSQYTTSFSGVCSAGGLVNLAANTSGTCIITNIKKGRLKVIKKLIPQFDSGKFNLKIDGSPVVFNKGNNGTTGFVLVNATLSHSVGEAAANSITYLSNYVTTYSPANCAGSFTIPPGGTKICTITNKRKKKK